MKKIIALFLIATPLVTNAQLTKGLVYLSGSLGTSLQSADYHSQSSNSSLVNVSTNNSISISPSIGFMVSDKLALGVAVNYYSSLSKQESNSNLGGNIVGGSSKSESSGFGIAPFGRFYFPLSNSFYFALQGTMNFSRGNTRSSSSSSNTVYVGDSYSLGLNFKPVFLFFPAPKWGVEASIGNFGYNYTRNLPDISSNTSFGLGWGSFSFGVSYYFIKK